jgi:glutamate/tyrosine decarboxylase-like PLP-dependent enzyme
MLSMGEAGYAEAAARIFEATDWIRQRVRRHSRLALIGDSLFMVAFRVAKGDPLDVYSVMDAMSRRGWNLNGLHRPPACHLCVTLRHTEPGVKERFADDLEAAVAHVEAHPEERRGMAPVYGMAATLPLKGVVGDMLKRYVDLLYKV